MNKSLALLFISMAVHSFAVDSVNVSKIQGINMHRVSNRVLIYLNCLRRKATPQERKAAAESIRKDGPIILGSSIIFMGGGTIAALYGKKIFNRICNSTKLENLESTQENRRQEQNNSKFVSESTGNIADETTSKKSDVVNTGAVRNSNDLVEFVDIVEPLSESDQEMVRKKIENLVSDKSSTSFIIEGKNILLSKTNNSFTLMINADLSDREKLELYPYMQELTRFIAKEQTAEVDVIINANEHLFKSHFNGKTWLFKDKLITSTTA